MIEHHQTCNARYPEKTPGEAPQATTDVEIGDGEYARTCVDCGAFELITVETKLKEAFFAGFRRSDQPPPPDEKIEAAWEAWNT
jgi:hypothetical protein